MLRFILIFCVALLSWKSNYAHKRYKGKAVDLQIEKWDNSEMAVGYSAFSIKDKFVWCGSAIRSKEDGKYYLFYSAMDSGENCPPFIDSWVLGSKIGVAVSDSVHDGISYNHQCRKIRAVGDADPSCDHADGETDIGVWICTYQDKYYGSDDQYQQQKQ